MVGGTSLVLTALLVSGVASRNTGSTQEDIHVEVIEVSLLDTEDFAYPDSSIKEFQSSRGPGYTTNEYQPEQVHLSYLDDPTTMAVTWMTKSNVSSLVRYGIDDALNMTIEGSASLMVSGKRQQWVHRATMAGLIPGATYSYLVGSNSGWSDLKTMWAMRAGADWPVRLAVYGDLGVENARSLAHLQLDTARHMFDAVLHVGDFAYDLHDDDGKTGDEFLRMVEPIAAHVPYMTVAGNHEQKGNFSEYKARFSMPGSADGQYYTMDMGAARFVFLCSEFYYFLEYGTDLAIRQYEWLEEQLRAVDRQRHPWLVVVAHRPMYCSHFVDDKDCMLDTDLFRVGIPEHNIPGVEPLLMKYGVDLVIWAHVHAYERLLPVYNGTVYPGTVDQPYLNPGAPVHVITGSAGAQDHGLQPTEPPPVWSAFRSVDYGFTRLTVLNATHVRLEQVSVDRDGSVIDSMWLQRDAHVPYSQLVRTERGYLPSF